MTGPRLPAIGCGLLALAACRGQAPALGAPVELAPVARAWGLPVSDFLAPTPLGARDDTLCGWARDPTLSANVARWVAEGRLRWRVLVADGPEPRVLGGAGALAADLAAMPLAENALAARCQTARPRAILVLADRGASYGAVADAVELAREHGGYLDAWLAVAGPITETEPIPGFAPGSPLVSLVLPDARVAFSNRDGRGYAGPRDALAGPLASAAAPEPAGCVTFSARPAVPWVDALAAMEAVRAVGVDLHTLDMEGAPGAKPEERATVPTRPATRWELDATISAVPVRTLSRCGAAPMGWWCDAACIPDTGEWPESIGEKPGSPTLGELVYTAHRVSLMEWRSGEPEGRARELFDDAVLAEPGARGLAEPPNACEGAAKQAGVLRWLAFETVSESGVMRPEGWERGALTSLDPAFEATVAAVIEALAWRRAIAAGEQPWDAVRAAAGDEGPRAILAWDALVNPAWHAGRVDAALVGPNGSIRAAPRPDPAPDLCAEAALPRR
ncbi:MAG: hypothetical protein Q8P18_06865 [Pseudomonadota bacterium]|nr:hypothetical protein [Pseudomonadota bacterium]